MKAVFSACRRHGYTLCLITAAIIGLIFPEPGSRDGILHLHLLTQYGVMLVFFLHGAHLAPKNLRQGVANWRLHLFVQTTTFVFFPLLGVAILVGGRGLLPTDMLFGLFYLCALPSTITSSVAMTALARGNIAGAIFNATLSGLIGMLITPLLVSTAMQTSGHSLPLLPAVLGVVQTLLLPFVMGQLMRPLLVDLLERGRAVTTLLDRGVIVLIVLASFSQSAKTNAWAGYSPLSLLTLLTMTALLLGVVLFATTQVTRRLGFSTKDEIAAVFCGSKKSLVNGMPMASVLLAGHPGLGVLVLPMMVYHQLQLMVCAVLAERYARRQVAAVTPG